MCWRPPPTQAINLTASFQHRLPWHVCGFPECLAQLGTAHRRVSCACASILCHASTKPHMYQDGRCKQLAFACVPLLLFPHCVAFGSRCCQVAVGYNHTIAVASDGGVWTWGFGGYGRLGHKVQQVGREAFCMGGGGGAGGASSSYQRKQTSRCACVTARVSASLHGLHACRLPQRHRQCTSCPLPSLSSRAPPTGRGALGPV